ncbi:MAG: GntR family transcriptional regulator [Clostridia bacterium]|nr:GntR family transcriptional regulator [Clostridia bacterium]
MQLDRDSSVSLYQQIYSIWRQRIESAEFKPGDRIPTERELCEAYGVSQITVRQAIQMLVKDGLLVRRPRTGTHVAQRKFSQQLMQLTSFSEDMRSRGLIPGGHLVSVAEEEADALVAEKLKMPEGSTVVRIERLRTAEDDPIAIEIFRMSSALCPGLVNDRLDGTSLYDLLSKKYQVDLAWAEQSFESSLATAHEAPMLGIKRGAPVLRVERLSFDSIHRPVEYTTSVYRGDRYKLYVSMRRS